VTSWLPSPHPLNKLDGLLALRLKLIAPLI
jgi:hypothetical protein